MSEKYLHEMIDDIEVLIDEAKPARFSPGKIMIEKDVLMTVIEELRKQIPGEIERSHKIILNKDAILEDARVKSQIRSVQVHCAMSMRSWKMYKVMWQVSKKHRRVCLTSCYPH